MRCALIEYTSHHDQLFPSIARLCNALNIELDIYTNRKNLEKDVFHFCEGLSYRLFEVNNKGSVLKELIHQYRKYDFIILNSLEPNNVLMRFQVIGYRGKMLFITHNAETLLKNPRYKTLLRNHKASALVLNAFIAETLQKEGVNAQVLDPTYLGHFKPKWIDAEFPTIFGVQGNFEYSRRDYLCLLPAVKSLVESGSSHFKIHFIGNSKTADALDFKERAEREGLSDYFVFILEAVQYSDYYQALNQCDFILPLIHSEYEPCHAYLKMKLTSSLPLAIAMNKLPILPSEVANLYQLHDASINYRCAQVGEGMKRALHLDVAEQQRLLASLSDCSERLFHQSLTEFEKALTALDIQVKQPAYSLERSASVSKEFSE